MTCVVMTCGDVVMTMRRDSATIRYRDVMTMGDDDAMPDGRL